MHSSANQPIAPTIRVPTFRARTFRALASLVLVLSLALLSGCGRGLGTAYGPSKGYTAYRSLNGFAAFRDGFASAGFEHRDLNRLTDRINRASVIVWTPTSPSGIDKKTTRWMERWLGRGNKTLIYVIPDSGSEAEYYREARAYASPQQRLEYRRKYAEQLVTEHQWQVNRAALPSNGWFSATPKVSRSPLIAAPAADDRWEQAFQSTTADATPNGASEQRDNSNRVARHEWAITPYDKSIKVQTAINFGVPVGPGAPAWNFDDADVSKESKGQFEPLLETTAGDAIVGKVTNGSWPDSQVIVVAGGSMLTNFGLTRPSNRRLADQLIQTSIDPLVSAKVIDRESMQTADGEAPLVAFGSATRGFPVSEAMSDIPRATGAELLTIFPLSLVTIHMALLGIIICMTLLPTFGRPRKVVYHALTNFGDHLDAIASLMRKRGGENYARRRVSDYFRRVRGETSGKWVIDDPQPAKAMGAIASAPKASATQPPLSQAGGGSETKPNNEDENPFQFSEADR